MSVLLFLSYQRFMLSVFAHYFQYYYLPPFVEKVTPSFDKLRTGSHKPIKNPSTSSGFITVRIF